MAKIFLVKEPSEEEKGTKENGDWGALIFGNVIREYGVELSAEEIELLKALLKDDLVNANWEKYKKYWNGLYINKNWQKQTEKLLKKLEGL